MRIRTYKENMFLAKLLRVYRKAIYSNRKSIVIKIMKNAFYLDSMFSGIEKNEFVALHRIAVEKGLV
jgi:hypothetical protein